MSDDPEVRDIHTDKRRHEKSKRAQNFCKGRRRVDIIPRADRNPNNRQHETATSGVQNLWCHRGKIHSCGNGVEGNINLGGR